MYEHVSRQIDSCKKLIYKKASQVYRRIAPENKRWIDPEDVLQDALIAAWESSQSFRSDRGTKFSTYLYTGLDMGLSARYSTPLRQQKRKGPVLELDAPVGDGEDAVYLELSSRRPSVADVMQAVSGAVAVYRGAPPSAAVFFIGVLVSGAGRIRRSNADAIAGLEDICRGTGIGRDEMALLMGAPANRALVLEGIVGLGRRLGEEEDVKVLECITCREMFSLGQVRRGEYSAASLTCKKCLIALQHAEKTCFGRQKVVQRTRTVEGYSEADAECRLHCRDRAACRKANQEGERFMSPKEVEVIDELEDVSFDDVEPEAAPAEVARATADGKSSGKSKSGKTKAAKATKAAKPAKVVKAIKESKPAKVAKESKPVKAVKESKPAKVAKPEKERKGREVKSAERIDPKVALKQGLIKLDEAGRDLPFKSGSMLRWLLEQTIQPGGVELKVLEKEIKKLGYAPDFQLSVLRSGKSGDSGLRPYPSTHTWKIEEEKGRVRVYDLKRIAFYSRMARIRGGLGKRAAKADKAKKAA